MWVHFETKTDAVAKMVRDGWNFVISTGRWVSKDGTCRASIHPTRAGSTVAVLYEEIIAS